MSELPRNALVSRTQRRAALPFAGVAMALAGLVGCGGVAVRPPDTTQRDLARLSSLLERMHAENGRIAEKLDGLEKRLETPPAAKVAVVRPVAPREPNAAPAARPVTKVLRTTIAADEFTLKVQRALHAADYDAGPKDGKKGRRTTAALRSFQRDNSLPETGMADEATWLVLKRHLD